MLQKVSRSGQKVARNISGPPETRGSVDKNEVRERRSKDCNNNSNKFQHVERRNKEKEDGEDDDLQSGHIEFKNDEELQVILKQIMKNDKISSETKRSCASKLYEMTKNQKFEDSDDTLASEISEQINHLSLKTKNDSANFSVNSSSKLNENSKNKGRRLTKRAKYDSPSGFNNNSKRNKKNLKIRIPKKQKEEEEKEDFTGGYRKSSKNVPRSGGTSEFTFENTKEFEAKFEEFEKKAEESLARATSRLNKAEEICEALEIQRENIARSAIEYGKEMRRKAGYPDSPDYLRSLTQKLWTSNYTRPRLSDSSPTKNPPAQQFRYAY